LKGSFSAPEYAAADRNMANSLKEFARKFFKFAKVMMKIAIKLGTKKRNA
jgi:hypothetical protein